MTHQYKISGMSCNGCRTKVENTLNSIQGVTAKVTLEPPIATITMEKHIPTIESISSTNPTIILNEEPQYEEESIETNLSLADMEKTMIIKAF